MTEIKKIPFKFPSNIVYKDHEDFTEKEKNHFSNLVDLFDNDAMSYVRDEIFFLDSDSSVHDFCMMVTPYYKASDFKPLFRAIKNFEEEFECAWERGESSSYKFGDKVSELIQNSGIIEIIKAAKCYFESKYGSVRSESNNE